MLREASVIALDKTGTLTLGQPELTDLDAADGLSEDDVLCLVASVEARSEHPIGEAVARAAERKGLVLKPVSGFEALPGFGVKAAVNGRKVEIGADRLMLRLGHDVSEFAARAARLADDGKSPLYASIDGRLAAILAVSDPIKETTPEAIGTLHKLGLKVAMVTGDNRRTAEAIARRLEIDEVIAEVLPGGKVGAVKRLAGGGRRVAFVGDGINDAPALAAADIGIAIGGGTDIAIESADVVLMSGDLRGVSVAIALSKATIRNIRQNLFWAFAYNVALIPVAAGLLYPVNGTLLSPMLAAAAMGLSSVFVLTNALRLKAFSALGGSRARREAGTPNSRRPNSHRRIGCDRALEPCEYEYRAGRRNLRRLGQNDPLLRIDRAHLGGRPDGVRLPRLFGCRCAYAPLHPQGARSRLLSGADV